MKNLMFNEINKNVDEFLKRKFFKNVRFFEMYLDNSINENIEMLINVIDE